MWFKLLTLVHLCAAFPLKCPEPAQWALRANGHCTDPSKYFCLQNDLINGYSENCTRSDFQQPGRKAVLRGGIDAEICSVERYQPFPIKFFTNASTNCIFLKSFCNAEGQVVYDHGNRNTDRTCICDYRRGYTFLVKPENPCFCKPSQEDCSCYLKTCSNGSHILSSDYQCINKTDLSPVTQCRTITDTNDNSGRTDELKGNILKETNNPFLVSWNKRPTKLVVSGCTIVVILVLSIRILWGCRFRALPNQLDEEDRMQYTQLINDSTMEKRYFVKIMIVGKEGVGKTCLLRRLLNERIDDVTSTDGVDIVVRRCKINVHDGEWIIEKDISDNPVHRIQNALNQNQNMEKKTTIQTESMENEIFQIDDIKNDTSTVLSTLKPSTQMVTRSNEYTTDEGHISSLHEESTDTNDIKHTSETLENPNRKDIEMEGNVKDNKHRTITDTETTVKENEDDSKLSSLEMPTDLMSEIFSSPSASDGHRDPSALCGLWDFAGQKEFYATHQVFLTSSAIYLVVADMKTDILKKEKEDTKGPTDTTKDDMKTDILKKEKEDTKGPTDTTKDVMFTLTNLQTDGEYVDFWFDSIHCYQRADVNEPPVIVVFTGADMYEKEDLDKRKHELQQQLITVTANQTKYKHFRKCFYLSNKNDPKKVFQKLREAISETARKMQNWGESVPLKWILLEHLIEINKKKGTKFITFEDMVNLAKHKQIDISENEVISFLRVQSKIGNIIYFEEIKNLIILEPQWLVNAFRCLVSDKLDFDALNDKRKKICSHWEELKLTGKISDLLITTLFEQKDENQFLKKKEDLLEVMKMFDILVDIHDKDTYMIPSMMPSSNFETVCQKIGISEETCERTSWFCLKFEFLPPVFFNHLSAWFITNYKPSKLTDNSNVIALYREICVFDFDNSACDKLLMTMSTDTIAVQVVSFDTKKKDLSDLCISVRKTLERKIKDMTKRYSLNLCYEKRFKCSAGKYNMNTMPMKDLISAESFYCLHHKKAHESKFIYSPWTKDDSLPNETNIPVKCHYCEKMPVYRCYECSNVLCDDCYLKHDKLTNTKHHTFQSTNDKLLLNNTFKVSDEIFDIKSLPGGLLVFVVFPSYKLLTYSVSDKQRNEISVGKQPRSIAIVDRNTVVVLLSPDYGKIDSIGIVDIRQRQVIQHVDCTFYIPSYRFCPMFYTDDQLYISNHSGITVMDMSGTIDREIELGFVPKDMCYDSKAARIYCIDRAEKKLTCIDRDGNTIFTFTDPSLTSSKHLTIDNEGYVLVLCRDEDDYVKKFKVHRISPDGKSSEVIITGKYNKSLGFRSGLSSICFQEESDEVIIGVEETVYTFKTK